MKIFNWSNTSIVWGTLALVIPMHAQSAPVKPQIASPAAFPHSLPVLTRRAGGGSEEELTSLLGYLSAQYGGEAKREKLEDRVRATSKDWSLDVFGDGTAAEFLDHAVAARAHESGVDRERAMTAQSLEAAGRSFVEHNLSKVIALRDGERLITAATSFRTESGIAADGSHARSSVVAARIVFGREIRGVPVVGAGSKVTITFLNDGAVESFRYDWPVYEQTSRTQQIAASSDILQRVQRVAAVRMDGYVGTEVNQNFTGGKIDHPLALSKQVQLQDLSCGYYDPSLLNRDAHSPIQSGCYYHLLEKRGEGDLTTVAGYSGAVPAATSPVPDNSWPEEAVLRAVKPKGLPPARQAGPGKEIVPVPQRPGSSQAYPERK